MEGLHLYCHKKATYHSGDCQACIKPLCCCSKYSEFALWASEVMKLDIEILPKIEEKELFRTFCEDFNTATLPHQKYYSLEDYERKRADESAKRGLSEVGYKIYCPEQFGSTAFVSTQMRVLSSLKSCGGLD